MNAIEERQQKIAEGLAAADRSQKDLAQAQEKVNEALKSTTFKTVLGDISFDSKGDIKQPAYVWYVWKPDGKYEEKPTS